jgi:hypothetical protein
VPGLGRLRRAMLPRHQGAAHQGQQRKPHVCLALQRVCRQSTLPLQNALEEG